MFNSLVENALDFLARAITEIDTDPKYSVIHFHAAVELIIKARLMHEHWSLVIAKNSDPDWEKFVAGDFQSVTLDEAAAKLHKIARSGLTQTELEAFRGVAKHRNKMVHFFHEAGNNETVMKQNIVKQQLKAWNYLHQLVGERWKEVFVDWAEGIKAIDKDLRKLHDYLQVIYESLKDKIKTEIQAGFIFEDCPSCGFTAQQNEGDLETIYDANCLVCGLVEKCVRIECPACNSTVKFANEGVATCPNCDKVFDEDDLGEILIDQGAAHIAAREGDFDAFVGNCSECDGYHTVVQVKNTDDWFCTQCFSEFDGMETCQWCNDRNSGDMEFSYAKGCNHCEGMAGWHKYD